MTVKRILFVLLGLFIMTSENRLLSEKNISVTLSIDFSNLSRLETSQISQALETKLKSYSGLKIVQHKNNTCWKINVIVGKIGESYNIAAKLFNPNGKQVFLKTYSELTDVKAVQNRIPNLFNEIYQKMN